MSRDNSPPFSMDDFEGNPAFLMLVKSRFRVNEHKVAFVRSIILAFDYAKNE